MPAPTPAQKNSFPRRARVLSPVDFERILKGGARRTGQQFIVLVAKEQGDIARLGVVASKRAGTAPQRNRAKRLVREWFRARRAHMTKSIVVIIRNGASKLALTQAAQQLDRLVGEERARR